MQTNATPPYNGSVARIAETNARPSTTFTFSVHHAGPYTSTDRNITLESRVKRPDGRDVGSVSVTATRPEAVGSNRETDMISENVKQAKSTESAKNERNDDPWRYRCPNGHSSIEYYPGTDSYYCQTCGAHFPSTGLRDLKADGGAASSSGGEGDE